MNLQTIQKVQTVLTDKPTKGYRIAQLAELSFEDAYRALVWLYDRELARMERKAKCGEIAGWVA